MTKSGEWRSSILLPEKTNKQSMRPKRRSSQPHNLPIEPGNTLKEAYCWIPRKIPIPIPRIRISAISKSMTSQPLFEENPFPTPNHPFVLPLLPQRGYPKPLPNLPAITKRVHPQNVPEVEKCLILMIFINIGILFVLGL